MDTAALLARMEALMKVLVLGGEATPMAERMIMRALREETSR